MKNSLPWRLLRRHSWSHRQRPKRRAISQRLRGKLPRRRQLPKRISRFWLLFPGAFVCSGVATSAHHLLLWLDSIAEPTNIEVDKYFPDSSPSWKISFSWVITKLFLFVEKVGFTGVLLCEQLDMFVSPGKEKCRRHRIASYSLVSTYIDSRLMEKNLCEKNLSHVFLEAALKAILVYLISYKLISICIKISLKATHFLTGIYFFEEHPDW